MMTLDFKAMYKSAYSNARIIRYRTDKREIDEAYEALNSVPHEVDCNAVFSLNNRRLEFTGWVNHDRRRRFLARKDAIAPIPCAECGETSNGRTFHGLKFRAVYICKLCQIELEIGE